MQVMGWRYSTTDKTFHCYTMESKHSLCNAHELTRHGATASQDEIPRECICVFCRAVLRQTRRQRREAIGLDTNNI